ncbi:DUF7108 family protein [Halegenticoccus soli]|uniref:DUF7108 family protein n=1 Tax=Halegenticoccus soli TaxID=1985678 RepID=UPI000C6D503B|nr:rnhA operon protein [Halegenticoccus soli]
MAELPPDVIEEAERLTRLARSAVDGNERDAYESRRSDLLEEHGYAARIRPEDDVLVLHPSEWVVDGTIRVDRIDDTDRAVERPLSASGDEDDWEAVEAHNAAIVAEIAAAHGDVHGANARAFADFMGNHYVRRVEDATAEEIAVFLEEYYPRNAWPTAEEKSVIAESLELLFAAADADVPGFAARR